MDMELGMSGDDGAGAPGHVTGAGPLLGMRGAQEPKGRSIGVVESGEPPKPEDERPSTTWLILERLDDISAQVSDVRAQVTDVRAQVSDVRVQVSDLRGEVVELRAVTDARFEAVDLRFDAADRRFDRLERRWTWSLGIVAMMMLGLLTKLLLPGV